MEKDQETLVQLVEELELKKEGLAELGTEDYMQGVLNGIEMSLAIVRKQITDETWEELDAG